MRGVESNTQAVQPTDADEIDRQLLEIDENLMRSEVTPTQMAEHLAKRKELWEARDNAKSFRENRDRGRPKEFAADTAEKTGVGKLAINMAVSRAQKLSPEVRDMIRGTEMDKGTVLDQLAKVPMSDHASGVQCQQRRRLSLFARMISISAGSSCGMVSRTG